MRAEGLCEKLNLLKYLLKQTNQLKNIIKQLHAKKTKIKEFLKNNMTKSKSVRNGIV